MKKVKFSLACAAVSTAGAALLLAGVGCADQGKNITLNGAGASFPAPVYREWTGGYTEATAGVTVNYQSIGSGAGLNQIEEGTVDFAGSDNPLDKAELDRRGLVQFPMLTGGVVVVVNLPGITGSQLRLSRTALGGIFLGRITKWNDPEIVKCNPKLVLPDLRITVVHRADASGTSFIFTNYLAKISKTWKDSVGCGSSVKWPVGLGGQKNPGVCNNVARIRGAIGYTEYTYGVEAKLAMPALENREKVYVEPNPANFAAGAAGADWRSAPGFRMVLTDQPGRNSWPVTGVTYIIFRKDAPEKVRTALIHYFDWCFVSGGPAARRLHYVPLPENVVKLIRKEIFQ